MSQKVWEERDGRAGLSLLLAEPPVMARSASRSDGLSISARVMSGLILGLALLVGLAGTATAANFVSLSAGNPNAEGVVIWGLDALGDRAVGSLVVSSTGDQIPFGYDEDSQSLQDISFLQPSGSAELDAVARGQQSSPNGAVRFTVGHISEGPVAVRSVFVISQGAGPGTFLPKFPVASSLMTAQGIGGNGNVIGRTSFFGGAEDFFHNRASSTYTLLTGIDAAAIDARGERVVGRLLPNASNPVDQAMIWEEGEGPTALGALASGASSRGLGISAAGRIVVGASGSENLPASQQEAFRWHPDLGMHALEPIADGASRESAALASSDANSV